MNTQAPAERPKLVPVPPSGAPDAPPLPPADAAPPDPGTGTGAVTVAPARLRTRHWGMMIAFVLMVVAPTVFCGWYLWERAADRYVSSVAFSIRTSETTSPLQILGGLSQLAGAGSSSSSDTDILYQFIQSQELVERVNAELDLRTVWSRGDPQKDPYFAYHPPGTIEDLMAYWPRMVKVYNDSGTGIINIQVQAFTPKDAQDIAAAIYRDSSEMINRLSAIAREDGTRYAREDRDTAVTRLKEAREAVTRFRNRTQIVDPAANVQNQMGILSSLQTQLAETLIARATLKDTVPPGDPRIVQADRKIEVIKEQIAEERRTLGFGTGAPGTPGSDDVDAGGDGNAFADLVGEYERLKVDQEFAEQTYTAAMAAYDGAVADARRQSRYLAAHVQPTLAEAATQPARVTLLALVALFCLLTWVILGLIYYSVRDRR